MNFGDVSKIKSMSPNSSSTNYGKSAGGKSSSGGITTNTMPVESVAKKS